MQPTWVRIGLVVLSISLLAGCSWFGSILPASRGSVSALREDLDTLYGRVGSVERRLAEQQAAQERLEKMVVQVRDDLQAISKAQQAATDTLDQAGKELQGMSGRMDHLERAAAKGTAPK
ncbi:MAG: hypothetical protein HY347_06555 [candidate division NC10 bacterium]|nr:hypothetical protein [candidate division NC10 bacterium]